MKKKIFIFAIPVAIIVFLGVFIIVSKPFTKAEKSQETIEITRNKPATSDLPYVTLIPRKDGNAFNLNIKRISQNSNIEYEITYLTGENVEQGIVGQVAGESDYTKEHLFGTCSTKVCKYDKGVEFGQYSGIVKDETNEYETKFDFHLQNLGILGGTLSLKDESAVLELPKGALSSSQYIICHSTDGLPVSIKDKLIAGPVGFFSSGVATLQKDATLTINLSDQAPTGDIAVWAWDNKNEKWIEFPAEVKDQKVTSKVNLLTSFIVVEKQKV